MNITNNEWADFWRDTIGVNVIPADTKNKTTNIEWSIYQNDSISDKLHEEWKNNGSFDHGMAIVLGKIHRGPYVGKYLACIDIDNKKGIDEFLFHFGKLDTLEKLAEKTIIEQHQDDKDRAHVYFIVEKPLSKRSGIAGAKDNPDIPGIEVKSEGSHGIMFCTPSIHMNGHPYQIIGTIKLTVLDQVNSEALENTINMIYQKYESSERNKNGLIPISELFKVDFTIYEGRNRQEAVLRVCGSLIQRLKEIYTIDQIRNLTYEWNKEHCKPPLDDEEFESKWQAAIKRIGKISPNSEEKPIIENEELEFLKDIKQRYICIFYDQLNRLYVTIKINDHIENIPLDSKRFKSLIRKEILEKDNKTINDDKLERIVKSIQAEMIFDENIERKELSLRVAGMDDNNTFYYDLTNHKWEIVKIASDGWQIVSDNSIPLFKRYENNINPQVYPKKDDHNNQKYFKEFLNLFNLRTTKDRLLLESYLISLFIPDIQKAILVISGNGGGAKTTTFSLIKNIIDPSTIDTLSFSHNKNDLIQSLEHNYVNYFDNVSHISQEVSDILCRAVTGSGTSKRELYTTDEDYIYKFKRCIGINGINPVTTRPDFVDRSLNLKVERIPENKRKKEEDIKNQFERLRPYVLGYIFDILVRYLNYKEKHNGEIIFKNSPRMADFAESCEIISRCLGQPENAFINAYRENIDNQNDEIIEASPIAESLITFMENKQKRWIGTPTQLYHYLGDIVSQVDSNIRRSIYWPKGPNRLTYKINEIIPNLLKRGIEIVTGEKINGQRVIVITKIDSNQSLSQKEDDHKSISLSSNLNFIEPLSSYINLYIHRKGSSDIFECEKCPLAGDFHLMKEHHCC
ncbi:MAG: bifunctional DNA primase/polymerase [Candidatus Nitrosocosmicus sp.]|nr:bifunctional DNA primase/polymerase [Candidatus Nitrosocosmicus sp.]MDN5866887.1 bifunctional DNA primase/polymerase [Candidatus Nitrosocosmicus sp.]